MAKLIPAFFSNSTKSNAEKSLFKLFERAPGTENWTVLYSLSHFNNPRVFEGECDFIVIAPDLGTFVLEVKGGRVERDENGWAFINAQDEINYKSRGPFEQAKDGMHAIRKFVMENYKPANTFIDNNPSKTLFGYGVMFPDISVKDINYGADVEKELIYDCNYRQDIRKFIEHLSQYWSLKLTEFHRVKNVYLPTIKDCQNLVHILRPEFDLTPSLSYLSGQLNGKLLKLTEEQYKAIDSLKDNPRILFSGNAGTGKTVLALNIARTTEKNNIVFLCYNRKLADYLKETVKHYGIEDKFTYIGTFHGLMIKKIKEAGLYLDYSMGQNEDFYGDEIFNKFATSIIQLDDLKCDLLIVDEFQDLLDSKGQIMEIFDLFLTNGVKGGNFYFFGDFKNQDIYQNRMPFEQVKRIISLNQTIGLVYYELTTNCRNSKEICENLEVISGVKYASLLDETSIKIRPEYIQFCSSNDEVGKLQKLIQKLVNEDKIDKKAITILSPVVFEKSCLNGKSIKEYSLVRSGITFSTIHSFKGLESDCVILIDIDGYESENDRILTYIAMSRAKSLLFIFESQKANKERMSICLSRLS